MVYFLACMKINVHFIILVLGPWITRTFALTVLNQIYIGNDRLRYRYKLFFIITGAATSLDFFEAIKLNEKRFNFF